MSNLPADGLFAWMRKLRAIVKAYDADKNAMAREISRIEGVIRERTTVSADISIHPDDSYVVVCGRYRDVDYVRTFRLDNSDFKATVEHLQQVEREYGRARFVDMPPQMRSVYWRRV